MPFALSDPVTVNASGAQGQIVQTNVLPQLLDIVYKVEIRGAGHIFAKARELSARTR